MIKTLATVILAIFGFPLFAADEPTAGAPTTFEGYVDAGCESLLDPFALTRIHRVHRFKTEDLIPRYEIGTPRADRVHDQCSAGTCWSEAITGLWEFRARKAFGRPVHLSPEFALRNRIVDAGHSGHADGWDKRLELGSHQTDGMRIVDAEGVVPSDRFAARFPFRNFASVSNRIELDLNLLTRYHTTTGQSELLGDAVAKYLTHYFNEPPETFSFDGREWTPRSFAREIVRDSAAPTDLVEIEAVDLGLQPFLAVVAAHIRRFKEPVVVTMDWDDSFFDDVNAIMTIGGFISYLGPNLFATPQAMWATAQKLRPYLAPHCVLAWDFAIDTEHGEISSLLVLNSWGKRWGDAGYAHVYKSYLQHARPRAMVSWSVLKNY